MDLRAACQPLVDLAESLQSQQNGSMRAKGLPDQGIDDMKPERAGARVREPDQLRTLVRQWLTAVGYYTDP